MTMPMSLDHNTMTLASIQEVYTGSLGISVVKPPHFGVWARDHALTPQNAPHSTENPGEPGLQVYTSSLDKYDLCYNCSIIYFSGNTLLASFNRSVTRSKVIYHP